MGLAGRNHEDRPAIDRHRTRTEMLHAGSAQIKEELGEAMDVFAEFLDPRHVLVQRDPTDRKSRPADFEVLEEDGLEFVRFHSFTKSTSVLC
jgi:hypothetical protein